MLVLVILIDDINSGARVKEEVEFITFIWSCTNYFVPNTNG